MDRVISHTRSVSLPSQSHPLDTIVENQLSRLRSSSEVGTSSISQNLFGLKDLYELVIEKICLPHSQQDAEEVIEGSLALLDLCGSTQDLLSEMKSSVVDLQSSLRRRNSAESSDISAYKKSRKIIIKMAAKLLVSLKKLEKNHVPGKDTHNLVTILRESEQISLSILRSVLGFFAAEKGASQKHSLSMVAKLVNAKQVLPSDVNEVHKIDRSLYALNSKISSIGINDILRQLKTLEMTIVEIEDALESFSRTLVKTRISILNVLSN